jgi:hypothetical protein
MSVVYTNISDGQNVGTLATNLNSFGNATVEELGTLSTEITNIAVDIVCLQDTGLLYCTASVAVVSFVATNGGYTACKLIDQAGINHANGNVTASSTGTITFVNSGVYTLTFSGSAEIDNGESVWFNYRINGVEIIANPPVFTGLGVGKPTSLGNNYVISATAGDTISTVCKSDAATTTVTPFGCSLMVVKIVY